MDAESLLTTLNGVGIVAHVALNIIITELTKKQIVVSDKLKHALSWTVSIGVAFVYNFLDLGIFAGLKWYNVLVYGFIIGLISNGVFSLKMFLPEDTTKGPDTK